MKKITLVTGNMAKVMQAKIVLEPLGYEINNIKIDTVEIQVDTVEEVASYSAKWASDKLKSSVVKIDSGISIDSLNGFPGPYTHYIEDTIGIDGILKLMKGIENRNAKFIQALAYCEYGSVPVVFKSITEGTISRRKSGKYGWSYDFIFIPKNKTKTLGNFKDEERFKLWNDACFQDLAKYLNNK